MFLSDGLHLTSSQRNAALFHLITKKLSHKHLDLCIFFEYLSFYYLSICISSLQENDITIVTSLTYF